MTTTDPTEQARRALVPEMSAALRAVSAAGGQIWTTDQMREDFDVLGFQAPFMVVRRKSDQQTGSLQFTHSPRYYFGWEAAQ